jgi:hypothetical protein
MGCPTLPTDVEAVLTSVKATTWSGSKISGIDLASDFVWIDDEPLAVEVAALQSRNLLNRLVVIDTNPDDDGLLRAIAAIDALPRGGPGTPRKEAKRRAGVVLVATIT